MNEYYKNLRFKIYDELGRLAAQIEPIKVWEGLSEEDKATLERVAEHLGIIPAPTSSGVVAAENWNRALGLLVVAADALRKYPQERNSPLMWHLEEFLVPRAGVSPTAEPSSSETVTVDEAKPAL